MKAVLKSKDIFQLSVVLIGVLVGICREYTFSHEQRLSPSYSLGLYFPSSTYHSFMKSFIDPINEYLGFSILAQTLCYLLGKLNGQFLPL